MIHFSSDSLPFMPERQTLRAQNPGLQKPLLLIQAWFIILFNTGINFHIKLVLPGLKIKKTTWKTRN